VGFLSPQIIHFNRVFHYKPSILGIPLFSETPIESQKKAPKFYAADEMKRFVIL